MVVTWYGMDEGDEVHVEEFLYLRVLFGDGWLGLVGFDIAKVEMDHCVGIQYLCMYAEHVLCDIEVVLHFIDR